MCKLLLKYVQLTRDNTVFNKTNSPFPGYYSLQIDTLLGVGLLVWWELRDALIYGNEDKSLEVNLILCPFSRMIVVSFLQGPIAKIVTGSWTDNGAKYGFHLMADPTTQKGFGFSQMLTALLYQLSCLCKLVTVVAYSVYSLVKVMIIFLLW